MSQCTFYYQCLICNDITHTHPIKHSMLSTHENFKLVVKGCFRDLTIKRHTDECLKKRGLNRKEVKK